MSLFVILAFIFIALSFVAFKLFQPKQSHQHVIAADQQNDEVKSRPGFVKVDLLDVNQLDLSLTHDGFNNFKYKNYINQINTVHLPKNNRYCYYHCNLGTQENEREERRITLHLQLNENQITFLKVFDIELKETNEKINGITFEVECSNSKVSLEKAFNDYQHLMKELLDFGCQNYFGLAEPRFKKEQYLKLLESGDYHAIAPDLIQFDEFKAVFHAKDFSSLDSYFYCGDFTIYICYNRDYSASFEIDYAGTVEDFLSFFGHDDLYLDQLSLEEKQVKLNQALEEYQDARALEEQEAKANGFMIDEEYRDPFKRFKI